MICPFGNLWCSGTDLAKLRAIQPCMDCVKIIRRRFEETLERCVKAESEIERLRALLHPECPGCGLRPNLEHGGVVWCDECAGEIECLRHLNYEMRGLLDTVCDAWEEAEVIPDTFNRCRRVWLQDWYVNTRKLIK